MKIVIFGSGGLLGTQLKKTFKELSPYSFNKSAVDITNHSAVSAVMAQLEPDVVINTAAYTDVDGAEENPKLARKVNSDGVQNIADCAKENNSIMVHYSTDYIFNGKNKDGYTEDEIPMASEPLNVYGRSKLSGEKALRRTLPKHYIIRTSWLFGAGGEDFVDKTIQRAKEGKTIKAAEDQFSKPTYVKDLAQATRVLLSEAPSSVISSEARDPAENSPGSGMSGSGEMRFGTYHITNEGTASRLQWVEKIVEFYGKRHSWKEDDFPKIEAVKMDYFKDKAKRPAHSVLKNTKFIKIRPWEEALEEYLASPPKGNTRLA